MKKKKFIINLANENLTDAEISVLGRGSKFTDVPKDPKAYMLDRDAEAFMRKMRIRCLMANKKGKRIHRFIPASSWHPLSTPSLDLENYLESTRLELSKTKIINTHDNLTKPERQALISLRKKKHLDSSSQIGSCLVSRTKRLVRSVRQNLNALLNLYFMTCLLLNSQAPV